ncbi:hypothetical protein [Candidatus Enterovibrio escicola]|uniref:hypothetical protein n=1 Tax=Candidatus Enterovibrio escicola TaxID=1927127 RepID=UPI001237FD8D|nr:hypothetical protein [Candidatus Enterovibrio escacola]
MNNSDAVFTYIDIDGLWQVFFLNLEKYRISGFKTRNKSSRLSISEIMLIIVSLSSILIS